MVQLHIYSYSYIYFILRLNGFARITVQNYSH